MKLNYYRGSPNQYSDPYLSLCFSFIFGFTLRRYTRVCIYIYIDYGLQIEVLKYSICRLDKFVIHFLPLILRPTSVKLHDFLVLRSGRNQSRSIYCALHIEIYIFMYFNSYIGILWSSDRVYHSL